MMGMFLGGFLCGAAAAIAVVLWSLAWMVMGGGD